MSKSRQPPSRVRGYSATHPPGRVLLPTQPGWDQLVLAHSGLFTAHARDRVWTVPEYRAICIPDGSRVSIETSRHVAIRCLYAESSLTLLGDRLRVMNLKPLVSELIYHAIRSAPMDLNREIDVALVTLLADRIAQLQDAPLYLPFPVDNQAREFATSVMDRPERDLNEHLRSAATSRRTLERRFKTETQLSLGRWRRRARILASVALLTEDDNVTSTAYRVGYSSASSFIAAFRSELGVAPKQFIQIKNLQEYNH